MDDKLVDTNVSKVTNIGNISTVVKPFYNRLNLPSKDAFVSNKPTKVQESPLDARTPQEVLDYHGMYRDPSYYEQNPDKIYLDLTQFDDYETHLNNLNLMKERFKKLPIDVRARFNHDPMEFFKHIQSPDFDIETVMDDKTLKNYRNYKAQEKARADFEAYQKSDEYKSALRDAQLRAQFSEVQFQEWLKKENLTN